MERLSLAGDQGLDILAAGYPKWAFIDCDPTAPDDGEMEAVTAGGSSVSHDPDTDEYTYVWKTEREWATKCMPLELKLIDSTSHYANVKFIK